MLNAQSQMVWDCMSATGVGEIYFLKDFLMLLSLRMSLIIFIPYIEDRFGNKEFIFQHDLASVHSAESPKTWFRKKIPVHNWSVNGSDSNQIENLWGILTRIWRKYYRSNHEKLKQVIIDVWTSVLWFTWCLQ